MKLYLSLNVLLASHQHNIESIFYMQDLIILKQEFNYLKSKKPSAVAMNNDRFARYD